MSNENERRLILQMIESGKITAPEGLQLLQTLDTVEDDLDPAEYPSVAAGAPAGDSGAESVFPQGEPQLPEAASIPVDFDRLRGYWRYPLWVGVGITVLGGLLLYWAWQISGLGFWFAIAWIPFLLGVLVLVLAVQARNARWLHVRIQQPPGEHPARIAISLPLPLGLSAWFLRTFRGHIRGLEETALDEVILALRDTATQDTPFYVDIEDEEDGEHVQIYIG